MDELTNWLCIALSVALLVQTRRLRHANQAVAWNAALATKAKRQLEQQCEMLGVVVEESAAELAAWRARLRP